MAHEDYRYLDLINDSLYIKHKEKNLLYLRIHEVLKPKIISYCIYTENEVLETCDLTNLIKELKEFQKVDQKYVCKSKFMKYFIDPMKCPILNLRSDIDFGLRFASEHYNHPLKAYTPERVFIRDLLNKQVDHNKVHTLKLTLEYPGEKKRLYINFKLELNMYNEIDQEKEDYKIDNILTNYIKL